MTIEVGKSSIYLKWGLFIGVYLIRIKSAFPFILHMKKWDKGKAGGSSVKGRADHTHECFSI